MQQLNYFGMIHQGITYLPVPKSDTLLSLFDEETMFFRGTPAVLVKDRWPDCLPYLNAHYRVHHRCFLGHWEDLVEGRAPFLLGWDADKDNLIFRSSGIYYEWRVYHERGRIYALEFNPHPYERPVEVDMNTLSWEQHTTGLMVPARDVPPLQDQLAEIQYYFQEWDNLDNSFRHEASTGLDWVTHTDIMQALQRLSIAGLTRVYRCLQQVYEDSQRDGDYHGPRAGNLVLHAIFDP